MSGSRSFRSVSVARIIAMIALGFAVSFVSPAFVAAEAAPTTTPPATDDKPVVPVPEKKATPDANPIPKGPAKETPGGESKKDVVPAKENKATDKSKDADKAKTDDKKHESNGKAGKGDMPSATKFDWRC